LTDKGEGGRESSLLRHAKWGGRGEKKGGGRLLTHLEGRKKGELKIKKKRSSIPNSKRGGLGGKKKSARRGKGKKKGKEELDRFCQGKEGEVAPDISIACIKEEMGENKREGGYSPFVRKGGKAKYRGIEFLL